MCDCHVENFVVQSVESKCSVRDCCKLPISLGPAPTGGMEEVGGWGSIPSLEDLGLHEIKAGHFSVFIFYFNS